MNMHNMLVVVLMLLLTTVNIPAVGISDIHHEQVLIEEPDTGRTDWNPGDDYNMHFPQLPDPNGWDVDATYVEAMFPKNCLADDWKCSETGPITDIHFWGSWQNDAVGTIVAFSVAIAADIPSDHHSIPYSRPGDTLWERTFYFDDWVVAGPWVGLQGWYDAGEGFYMPDDHTLYWQYNIENISNPFVQQNGTIYWLSISAIVLPESPQPRWGWKSSDNHWNDQAVHGFWYELEWMNLSEPPTFETSLDLAFVITGNTTSTNHPPNTPAPLTGPNTGPIYQALTYFTNTTDPDGDSIRYGIDHNSDGLIDYWSIYYYPSGTKYFINITFYYPGTYYVRVKAEDTHGAQSGFSVAKVITITGANDPPNTPTKPTGPDAGSPGHVLTFTTSSTDPDGDQIKFGWDWNGDGTIDEWSVLLNSGTMDTRSHTWNLGGTYHIQVKAEDEHGAQSPFSMAKIVTISSNMPPLKPIIQGPSMGRMGQSYTYSSTTTDPESNQLYYWFDWADGTNSGWVGPYASGQTASMSHLWTAWGSYSIKVMVKDTAGAESVWSDPLAISMPYIHNLHRGRFHAELGLKDDRETKLSLDGYFTDARNKHLLYGSGCLVGSERMFRFQGIQSRNRFIIQTAVNSRIINIVGLFDSYNATSGVLTGSWRGSVMGYGATYGWIRASYS